MPIEVHDWVVHPQHGVGRVVKLETRRVGAQAPQRYFEIALTKGTIWVPVDESSRRLRRLTARGDLGRYRSLLRSRPTPLDPDHRKRQLALAERVKESSFQARCELIRDLTAHSWNKPLKESGSTLLRSIQDVLYAEWAAAEGLSVIEAAHEVEALLLEGRKTYNE